MRSRTKPLRPPSAGARPKNRLLAMPPDREFERLRPKLRTSVIAPKQIFHASNEPIQEVIFLNGGVASVTTLMRDGTVVEMATTGREGMVGMDAFFGGSRSTAEVVLQVPNGTAEFLRIADFRAEVDRRGGLFDGLQRYSQGFVALIMQSVACMATHPVQDRMCRWLLMMHDRVGGDEFQLSQEFIAMMLGSSRPTVSVIASTLQRAGLISYTHARMTITNRVGLESASCECYATVKARFDQLGL